MVITNEYNLIKVVIINTIIVFKEDINVIVKNNLRVLMAQHKMNIKDVHEKTGLSRTTISKLYNEESTKIGMDTIAALCTLFNCDVNELLYLDKES